MIITKTINNNIVTSVDDGGNELILTGRGLGFGAKKGQPVPMEKVEKTFSLDSHEKNNRLVSLMKEIPMEDIEAADLVISHAKSVLGDRLKDTIYLSLVDHIHCAIERLHADIMFANPLIWEIKSYYPEEFRAGIESLALLKKEMNIKFPVDEAGFLALHFITSEYETNMDVTVDIPKMLDQIVKIIEEYFQCEVDKTTIHFERFMTHLKFFIARVLKNDQIPAEEELFQQMIREQYKESYNCVLQIKEFMEKGYGVDVSEEEVVYLTVHIRRITMPRGAANE